MAPTQHGCMFTMTLLAAFATATPVVAVFDLEDRGTGLPAETLEALSDVLAARLVESQRFRLVPRDELRERLLAEKAESHRPCYAAACQIEIGKAVAAEVALAGRVVRVGDACHVNLHLYDLREETSRRAATARSDCDERSVLEALDAAAARLTERHELERTVRVDPLPPGDIEEPADFEPRVTRVDFGSIDVDALAAYQAAADADRDEALDPEVKISRWRTVLDVAPEFEDRAKTRIAAWTSYLASGQYALSRQREADWEKLDRLLRMRVVPEANKARLALAFVDAYGREPSQNPYARNPRLVGYVVDAEWAAVLDAVDAEADRVAQYRLVKAFLRKHPRHAEARSLKSELRPVFRASAVIRD